MQATEKRYYTPEEYLELEATADYKSEYIDGQIIAMAGGTTDHNQIALNLSTELNYAFKKQNYLIYMGDVRLWIPQMRIYTYPDVMILVGKADYFNNRKDIILNPQIIIEVLSKSTKGYDRKDKFEIYRTIPTFQEYLLMDQHRIHVEQFSKTGNKRWNLREYDQEDEKIVFASIPFEISLQDLYNKVNFESISTDTKNENPD